jgi:hypothetical protein
MASFKLPKPLIEAQLPLIHATLIVALGLGPQHQFVRVCITLPILILLVCQSLYKEQDGPWGESFSNNSVVVFTVFIYIDWILMKSPDLEQWHKLPDASAKANGVVPNGKLNAVPDGIQKDQKHVVPQGFLQRVWWGLRLATTWRYIGWSCQVKNVPVEVGPAYPRGYV